MLGVIDWNEKSAEIIRMIISKFTNAIKRTHTLAAKIDLETGSGFNVSGNVILVG